MMRSLLVLCLAVGLGFSVGCGPKGTPVAEDTGPPPSADQHMQDVQKMVDEGKIDPNTYGAPQGKSAK